MIFRSCHALEPPFWRKTPPSCAANCDMQIRVFCVHHL